MPRLTSCQKAIQAAQRFSRLVLALNVAKDQDEHGTAKDDGRSDSSQSMLEDVLLFAHARINSLLSTRYCDWQSYRPSNIASTRFLADLHSGDNDNVEQTGIAPWLNNFEFL